MDALFISLASLAGASVDQVKLISCLLISYPLGSIFVRIPVSRPNLRHLFSISVTSFYLLGILNIPFAYFQLLGDILATYFIAGNVKSPRMPWIVFGVIMGHLTLNHIIRAMNNLSYETFEITGPQMVLTMKLTTFAWNVLDGRRPAKDLDKWQTEKRVTTYPSLIGFLGYSLYFPGFLVGPSFEYAAYDTLVNGSLFQSLEQETENAGRFRKTLVPKGRKRVAYSKMLIGLAFLGSYVTFAGSFNLGVTIEDWFVQRSLLYRIAYLQLCGFFERTKYYAIWILTEGACILTGLGFTGFNASGGSRWEGAANVDVLKIEFPPNFKVLLDSWNMKTNVWLRECIYKRVTPAGKKPGFRSSMLTFTTSAFWHGIAGGYYLTFFFAGFVQTVQRLCRRHLRPLVLPASYVSDRHAPQPPQTPLKRIYDGLGIVATVLILNYAAAPFMLLTVRNSFMAWSRLGWYGHWAIVAALAFFYGGGAKWLKNTQAARAEGAKISEENLSISQGAENGTVADDQGKSLVLPPYDDATTGLEDARMGRRVTD
ncbi:uncharacterized protein FIBRA_05509 [Fibroporia radiculosa]|uniref:MBOAT-domain-containing protein n=1 Tax=Fibroporia radiculosa TaxID=599839 RepID=J4H3K0_9APHY|nr:uncharacterized protein FIBRA_05509 [Fibroporia radiculosa]CCM03379.1 predicted protein [Fibroporia radiculosa]